MRFVTARNVMGGDQAATTPYCVDPRSSAFRASCGFEWSVRSSRKVRKSHPGCVEARKAFEDSLGACCRSMVIIRKKGPCKLREDEGHGSWSPGTLQNHNDHSWQY